MPVSVVLRPRRRRKAARFSRSRRGGNLPTSTAETLVELTDAEWAAVAPLLPDRNLSGRRRTIDRRRIVTAINHHWRTGCPWRKLPPGCPAWSTVYSYFRKWLKNGTLRNLRAVLNPPKPSDLAPSDRRPEPPPPRLDPDRRPTTPPAPSPKPR